MSNSGKGVENCYSPTIGYRFNANSEELGEVLEPDKSFDTSFEVKSRPAQVKATGSVGIGKNEEEKNDLCGEAVKEYWGFLGRSVSFDSNYQSSFSSPTETWKKLNELKGKITKPVEEKISEIKSEYNASGLSKLINSKENSSISDSEDTSESSKVSEQWKDAKDHNLSVTEAMDKTTNILSNTLDTAKQNIKSDTEGQNELRSRKRNIKLSEIVNIKIVTAKTSVDGSFIDDGLSGDVESGVEADENLDSISFDAFDEQSFQMPQGNAQTPPGGSDTFLRIINYFISLKLSEVYTVVFIVGIGLYMCLPMTDFIKGFFACLLMITFCLKLKSYLLWDEALCPQVPFIMPDFNSLPPLKVPEYKPVRGVWINEYESESYDPDYYSVTQTIPAYLQLDNAILKLSRPKGKINKRATFDEPDYKLNFSSQRAYNISGCNVFLMPEGLTRKRLFSKKYPIVIFLKPDSFIGEKNVDEKESHDGPEMDDFHLKSSPSSTTKSSLYLFARCDRQKEEWYRKLLVATQLGFTPPEVDEAKHDEDFKDEKKNFNVTTTPFENIYVDAELAQEEYLRYMAKFVDPDSVPSNEKKRGRDTSTWYKRLKSRKKEGAVHDTNLEDVSVTVLKKNESTGLPNAPLRDEFELVDTKVPGPQIQWFNAFLNRILFDMFRSPYWLAKIHDKLYKKLNSIRLPYYIEEIEVIEMDLGKTGPTFHRVSQPYLDERGLWFDMDTTFDGMIRLTIQTHLNLVKLQKGIEDEEALRRSLENSEKGKKKPKEVRDQFVVKEPKEKSEETVGRTSKKSKKHIPRTSISSQESDDESHNKEESVKKNESIEAKSSDVKLYDEVARIAKIAIEEGITGEPAKDTRSAETESQGTVETKKKKSSRSPIYDSEVEDSAESSEEEMEEEEDVSPVQGSPEQVEEQSPSVAVTRRYPKNRRSSKKLFRMFENVAQSRYFKSVAQSKYIQKAIAGVSATKLKLTLEIKSCSGRLTVNIPPPPSDRFWYGFRDMPKLIFSANPKIGEKAVRFAQIKNYLQRKILHEIKKAMVLPNLIDFVLPTSEPAQSSHSQQIAETAKTPEEKDETSE